MTSPAASIAVPQAPELLRVPTWEQYPWLRAGFSLRQGGASQVYGPDEQNLGWTAEDDPAVVRANRERFAAALAEGAPAQMVTVRQVHGCVVRDLGAEPGPWRTEEGKALLEGDGLLTAQSDQLLAVLTADCVPILLADRRTRAVAALHAGWRGTLAGIAAEGVARMRAQYGTRPGDLIAAIGPSIRSCCFEVGDEVRESFCAAWPGAEAFFTAAPGASRPHLDLLAANRQLLREAGVGADVVTVVGGCTACSRIADGRREFFSYRAEGGRTGRMLSGIMTTVA